MNINPLTATSISNYSKVLANTLNKSTFEMFLHIGVNLIELDPEEQYINVLVQSLVDTPSLDMGDLNMRLRQLNDFYNDAIATYETVDLLEPNEEKLAILEEVVATMMSQQADNYNREILIEVLDKAVDTIAKEFGFYDKLYSIALNENLMKYIKEVAFEEYPGLYISFVPLLDMAQMLKKGAESDEFYPFALMTIISLSVFNNARKERFEIVHTYENEIYSGKIGRNEPCPCGSGKKYKKCCGKNNEQ